MRSHDCPKKIFSFGVEKHSKISIKVMISAQKSRYLQMEVK